jgi:hypothetical protein
MTGQQFRRVSRCAALGGFQEFEKDFVQSIVREIRIRAIRCHWAAPVPTRGFHPPLTISASVFRFRTRARR